MKEEIPDILNVIGFLQARIAFKLRSTYNEKIKAKYDLINVHCGILFMCYKKGITQTTLFTT